MAISAAFVTSNTGTTVSTFNVTGVALNPNTLYLFGTSVENTTSALLSDVTVTSPSATWTRIGTAQSLGTSSPTKRIELWYTMVTAPVASETITTTANNSMPHTEMAGELHSLLGINTSGSNGSGAVRTSNVVQADSGVTNVTALTLTYPLGFAVGLNAGFVFFASSAGATATFVPRTNWTELREFADAHVHHESQFRAAPDTAASFTGGTSGLVAGVAFEVVAAPVSNIIATYQVAFASSGAGSTTINSAGQTYAANTLAMASTLTTASAANLSNATITSPNLAWTRIGTPQDIGTSSPTRRIELWYSFVSARLTGEVVSMAIANGLSQTEYRCELTRYAGVDATTPVRTANVIQGDSGVSSATTFSLAFPGAFGAPVNGAVVQFGSTAGTSSTIVPRTGWTELVELGNTNDHHEFQFLAGNDTNATFSGGTSGLNAGIAVEIVADTTLPNLVIGRLQLPARRIRWPSFVNVTVFPPPLPQFKTPGILIYRMKRIF